METWMNTIIKRRLCANNDDDISDEHESAAIMES